MSDDKVLSQEEIDAMLAQSGSSSGTSGNGESSTSAASIEGVKPLEIETSPVEPRPAEPDASRQAASFAQQPPASSNQPAPPNPQPSSQMAAQPQGLDFATQAMLNNMAAKMQNLDAAMERVAQLEKALYETNNAVRQLQQEFQSSSGQIQLVSSRLEGVLANLKATLGYNAQKTFVCTNCHAKGEVAAEIKCTRCNKKNWWGWWPSKWR